MTDEILSAAKRNTNADLIVECARLGYLRREWTTLDPTWGKGRFWTKWRPDVLVGHDIDPTLAPDGRSTDATDLPYDDDSFDVVVIDGPYKLNGTSTPRGPAASDRDYGVHVPAAPEERMGLLLDMMAEGGRVAGERLFMKVQPQVVYGRKFWQDHIVWNHGNEIGWRLLDQFYFLGHRKQPAYNPDGSERRQVHSRTNYSTLMVFCPA